MSAAGFCTRHGAANVARVEIAPPPAHIAAPAVYLLPYLARNLLDAYRTRFHETLAGKTSTVICECAVHE